MKHRLRLHVVVLLLAVVCQSVTAWVTPYRHRSTPRRLFSTPPPSEQDSENNSENDSENNSESNEKPVESSREDIESSAAMPDKVTSVESSSTESKPVVAERTSFDDAGASLMDQADQKRMEEMGDFDANPAVRRMLSLVEFWFTLVCIYLLRVSSSANPAVC